MNGLRCAVSAAIIFGLGAACERSNEPKGAMQTESAEVSEKTIPEPQRSPRFLSQNAYESIEKQISFGPRTAGSIGHKKTLEWISERLTASGFTVQVQEKIVQPSQGAKFTAKNIIGSLGTGKRKILLTAHWDTRPNSDQDAHENSKNKPVLGANDGASGVAVLLEIARVFGKDRLPANTTLDIIFFDAEDLGEYSKTTSFCLGSQAWAREPHTSGYTADVSVNLDMVGAKNAIFPREVYSKMQAGIWVDRIWETAKGLGYSKIFVEKEGGPVVDDHFYVATLRGIPSVNIIHFEEGAFFKGWHTQQDDMRFISKETLEQVGKTVEVFVSKFGDDRWKN